VNCSRDLIEAYLDEELTPGPKSAVEEHLAGCADCSAAYGRLSEQRANIKSAAPYYSAPAQLQQSVRDALRREASTKSTPWRGLAIAASVLLAVSVAWNVRQAQPRNAENDLAQNVLSDHIRSLMGTHLLDVPSTDQHTVKPWFNGKLDFAPDVKNFAAQGFPLIGGRIEYLADRSVAALVYHRRQHVINVYTWPSSSADGASHFSRNGFNVLHWRNGSMTWWAVSDIPMAELEQFKALYQK
jgi:anti-sigma factor RsiW